MDREISPPLSKRRKLSTSEDTPSALAGLGITIYSWNVNGIAPFVQPSITSFFKFEDGRDSKRIVPQASLRDFLRRHGWPTVLFLQEVKINPDDVTTIHAVEKAARRHPSEPSSAFDYEAHFCLPTDKYNARGFGRKVYGVCSLVRKDFKEQYVEKIREVAWDSEGRVLVIETRATANLPKLALFNIYAVNGTEQPYKDPNTGKVIGTRHDRKLRFHAVLQAECRALEAEGFGVILGGDLNIARTTADGFPNLRTFPKQHCVNRADFEARFFLDPLRHDHSLDKEDTKNGTDSGLGMVDTFRYLHPDQRSYTFYPRLKTFGESCDRIDMVIISRSLKDNLRIAGMHETAGERGPSDHVPLYAGLAFEDDWTRPSYPCAGMSEATSVSGNANSTAANGSCHT